MADRRQLRRTRLLMGAAGLLIAAILIALSGWLALIVATATLWFLSRRRGVPVIVYHSVSPNPGWLPWARNISVRPQVFAQHMQVLVRAGWTVIPDATLTSHAPLPPRSVILHFDDAYLDVLHHAVPVLRDHSLPATIFASTDFIDPSTGLRQDLSENRGYLNPDELRALDADPLFEIAAHGKDHARIPVAGPATPRPEPHLWGPETAYLWSLRPGSKARWFETTPPDITVIPANDSALTGLLMTPSGPETPDAQTQRVTDMLRSCRADLSQILERDITYLCWPFDSMTPAARACATAAGFTRVTGGRAVNNAPLAEPILSRTHINDFAAGKAPIWIEALIFRAKLEVAAGNLLWWPLAAAANQRRKRAFPVLHGHSA